MRGVEVVVELSREVDHAIGESEVGAAAAISAPLLRDVRPEQKESVVLHASTRFASSSFTGSHISTCTAHVQRHWQVGPVGRRDLTRGAHPLEHLS